MFLTGLDGGVLHRIASLSIRRRATLVAAFYTNWTEARRRRGDKGRGEKDHSKLLRYLVARGAGSMGRRSGAFLIR